MSTRKYVKDNSPFKWFTTEELACRCCGVFHFSYNLGRILDEMRNRLGEPIYINSGYRCEKHNALIGGSKRSWHMQGRAADIRAKNITPAELWDLAQTVRDEIDPGFKLGYGLYSTFLHLANSGEHFDKRGE